MHSWLNYIEVKSAKDLLIKFIHLIILSCFVDVHCKYACIINYCFTKTMALVLILFYLSVFRTHIYTYPYVSISCKFQYPILIETVLQ